MLLVMITLHTVPLWPSTSTRYDIYYSIWLAIPGTHKVNSTLGSAVTMCFWILGGRGGSFALSPFVA